MYGRPECVVRRVPGEGETKDPRVTHPPKSGEPVNSNIFRAWKHSTLFIYIKTNTVGEVRMRLRKQLFLHLWKIFANNRSLNRLVHPSNFAILLVFAGFALVLASCSCSESSGTGAEHSSASEVSSSGTSSGSSSSSLEGVDSEQGLFLDQLQESGLPSVYWFCDFEDSSFRAWEDAGTDDFYSGGGIFLTAPEDVSYQISTDSCFSGRFCADVEITQAVDPANGPKAVRLMRWTDKAWNEGGDYFPDTAWYSVWMRMAENYNPAKPTEIDINGDGGWWNIFQFKSDNNAGSQPVAIVDVYHQNGQMNLALVIKDFPNDDSDEHTQEYIQGADAEIFAGKWHHIEALMIKSVDYSARVEIWLDGEKKLEADSVRTQLPPAESVTWGIGNYTDYVDGGAEPGRATISFDDAVVSPQRVGIFYF